MTYVMSDIHGEYDKFMELLDKIGFNENDTLYILGDIFDRGPHPIKIIREIMQMPNVICIVGNHELMGMRCLPFLMGEITEESIDALDTDTLDNILTWQYNGFSTTIREFAKLDIEAQQAVIDYIGNFTAYEQITVNNQKYILVHAGLGDFSPEKALEDYTIDELVWERPNYNQKYFDDTIIITGHTPTQTIRNNETPGYIFRKNNHIDIDCGACFEGGRLAALCLDTNEEFYSSENT